MNLVIDNRESKLIEELKNMNIIFEIKTLNIGDAHIYNKNNDIIVIFERKSIQDLASSIIDGRYKEQSFRLNECPLHNHNIHYIIEGIIDDFIPRSNINKDSIYSSIVSLSYFKGFSVTKTNNYKETSLFIKSYLNKLTKENKPSFYINNSTETNGIKCDYVNTIKTTKKSMVTKDNITKLMLMQIPSVSVNIATAITNKYPSMIDLICELQENENCLDMITYINTSNKSIKISKPSIKNIKEFIIN